MSARALCSGVGVSSYTMRTSVSEGGSAGLFFSCAVTKSKQLIRHSNQINKNQKNTKPIYRLKQHGDKIRTHTLEQIK